MRQQHQRQTFIKNSWIGDNNKQMEDIMKIVKYVVECELLIKGVSKTLKNETKADFVLCYKVH